MSRSGRSISAVSMYGARVFTARVLAWPSAVVPREGSRKMPALWMTASIRPTSFTCSASPRVSAALARSPMTTPAARGARSATDAARSRVRAWRTTSWPSSMRTRAAALPSPSVEPVIKTRDTDRPSVAGLLGRGRCIDATESRNRPVLAGPPGGRSAARAAASRRDLAQPVPAHDAGSGLRLQVQRQRLARTGRDAWKRSSAQPSPPTSTTDRNRLAADFPRRHYRLTFHPRTARPRLQVARPSGSICADPRRADRAPPAPESAHMRITASLATLLANQNLLPLSEQDTLPVQGTASGTATCFCDAADTDHRG